MMAVDVVEELFPLIRDAFDRARRRDDELRRLRKLAETSGKYKDAHDYALLVSKHCAQAILQYIKEDALPNGRLYYNIAQRIITPMLRSTYNMSIAACRDVQRVFNEQLEMQLQPLVAEFEQDRVDGISLVASRKDTLDEALVVVESDIENYALHVVDETMHRNARFLAESGVAVIVERTAKANACDWCRSQAGVYNYADVRDGSDVWRRHGGCQCILEMYGDRGSRVIWQPK